ncbi:diacylglycerol/lipid kinase family protein [Ornithinibacillus californiensis]|uniref:diacylglycerol/lipid kinase family protein n=1 Tax=Ornithinibacillus californiensis TaxID=161536 RepID=UPI00064DAEA0|nr:YegS/Rv2252/BmrU family lipid kinase [Ornithinibacillus californiensis]
MYIFIVNPVSGNGRGLKVFRKLMKSKVYQQMDAKYYLTEFPGHAEKIAKLVVQEENVKAIVIIGGDGTVHEVINGMGDSPIPISFIPGGSGNDFRRGSGIKGSSVEILNRVIKGENLLNYWKGNYHIDNITKRQFINSMGFGFDAEVAKHANQSVYKNFFNKFHLGTLSYCIALIHVLLRFKPFIAELKLDGKKEIITDCWMVTIANHPYYGGGMKIIPTAKIEPNNMPILIIHGISKWKVLGLFLTVFIGKHITFKEVDLLQVENLSVNANKRIYYQVDGQTGSCETCTIVKNKKHIQIMGSNF